MRGVFAARPERHHLIVSSVEHNAVLEPAERLEREGCEVTRLNADRDGRLDFDELEAAIRDDTLLISIMLANNETGVVYDLRRVCEIAKPRGVLVHTDAVNALGKIPIDVDRLGVDLLSLSAHKIHGPKGCGALYIKRRTPVLPLIVGGAQERDRRGGTYNVPAIMGFGEACALCRNEEAGAMQHVAALRDRMEAEIAARFPTAHFIARDADRLPNTTCVCFAGSQSQALLMLLSDAGVCASAGAACSSGSLEPSHVLKAMQIDPHIAQGQIRLSLSRFNKDEDIERLLVALDEAIRRVGALDAGGA